MGFWKGKKVLVTGGAGFIGSHLVEDLLRHDARVRVVGRSEREKLENLKTCLKDIEYLQGDLRNPKFSEKSCKAMDIVIHLAAKVSGIGYNKSHPGEMFTENIIINTNIIEGARLAGVERYLCVSSVCIYSRICTIPTPESEGFKDQPEETNIGYGWAKRVAEIQARLYAAEYGMKIAIVRPANAYGPRDNFNPETSHVIPALIKRVMDREDPLVVWGDGEQTRTFLYVTDFVSGLMEITEKYPKADPLNIGTEEEIRIKDLISLIMKISGRSPRIVFDTSKPCGQPRRNIDISKAKELIGYRPKVSLEEGLKKTIEWYENCNILKD